VHGSQEEPITSDDSASGAQVGEDRIPHFLGERQPHLAAPLARDLNAGVIPVDVGLAHPNDVAAP
jgi:hypothetical protein